MSEQGNILFCGVGGQGILLASEVTAYSLLAAGMDVRKSEVHGMAQRGGSVTASAAAQLLRICVTGIKFIHR
jgi:indolepyruvate ferredoxin oxidoreductase beta subunit